MTDKQLLQLSKTDLLAEYRKLEVAYDNVSDMLERKSTEVSLSGEKVAEALKKHHRRNIYAFGGEN
jgi:hypothetical protein